MSTIYRFIVIEWLNDWMPTRYSGHTCTTEMKRYIIYIHLTWNDIQLSSNWNVLAYNGPIYPWMNIQLTRDDIQSSFIWIEWLSDWIIEWLNVNRVPLYVSIECQLYTNSWQMNVSFISFYFSYMSTVYISLCVNWMSTLYPSLTYVKNLVTKLETSTYLFLLST
jgi:hypothetical protein